VERDLTASANWRTCQRQWFAKKGFTFPKGETFTAPAAAPRNVCSSKLAQDF